jgi:hypothetical protein
MKKSISVLAAFAFLATSAFAAEITAGNYAEKNYSISRDIQSKKECKDNDGTWIGDDGVCAFRSDNTVKITKSGSVYTVAIDTISGGNGHACTFEEKAVLSADKKTLTSKVQVTDYSNDTQSTCTVTVKAKSGVFTDYLTVAATANCRQEYCGANAYGLDIAKAKKVK